MARLLQLVSANNRNTGRFLPAWLGKSRDFCPDPVIRKGECAEGPLAFLQCGVSIVRMDRPNLGPKTNVMVNCIDGKRHNGELCSMPFYDEKRQIPRGNRIDIPEILPSVD